MERDVLQILKTTVSPYDNYCSGTTIGQGKGYIVAPVISAAAVKISCSHAGSVLLDEIIAFDKAEAATANITQTNMITVSSFNGINGVVLGYDILKTKLEPHPLFPEQPEILNIKTLCEATQEVFGTIQDKRFPIAPGEHLPCAYKTLKQRGPTAIYGSLALAIPKDRENNADLFMEDLGIINSTDDSTKKKILANLLKSVKAIGQNLGIEYEKIFMGIETQTIAEDEVGCVITAAPYINIAKKAIPNNDPANLVKMSMKEWEEITFQTNNKSRRFRLLGFK